jgi:hypothetical protein
MACVDSDVLNHTETPAQFLYNDINDQAECLNILLNLF